MKARDKW